MKIVTITVFEDYDILIDDDGMPWMFYEGRWASSHSAAHPDLIISSYPIESDARTVKLSGLTTTELASTPYGPFRLVTFAKPIELDNESESNDV